MYGPIRAPEHKKWFRFVGRHDYKEAAAKVLALAQLASQATQSVEELRRQVREIAPRTAARDVEWREEYARAAASLSGRITSIALRIQRILEHQRGRPTGRKRDALVGRTVTALTPAELRRLSVLLTEPERAIMSTAIHIVRDAALGREQ